MSTATAGDEGVRTRRLDEFFALFRGATARPSSLLPGDNPRCRYSARVGPGYDLRSDPDLRGRIRAVREGRDPDEGGDLPEQARKCSPEADRRLPGPRSRFLPRLREFYADFLGRSGRPPSAKEAALGVGCEESQVRKLCHVHRIALTITHGKTAREHVGADWDTTVKGRVLRQLRRFGASTIGQLRTELGKSHRNLADRLCELEGLGLVRKAGLEPPRKDNQTRGHLWEATPCD